MGEERRAIGDELVVKLARPRRALPHLVLDHLLREPHLPELLDGVMHQQAVPPAFPGLHHDGAAIVEVGEPFELAHRPLVPPHQEHPQRQPVGHQHQVHLRRRRRRGRGRLEAADVDVGAERLAEAGDPVVDVGGRLAVREAVEEAAVPAAGLLLHAHLLPVLEVACRERGLTEVGDDMWGRCVSE